MIAWQLSYEMFSDLEQLAIRELDVRISARPSVYVSDRCVYIHSVIIQQFTHTVNGFVIGLKETCKWRNNHFVALAIVFSHLLSNRHLD